MMLIVVPSPGIDLGLRVLDRYEPVHVETLLPKPTIKRFDRRVVGRLAAPTEVERDAVRVGPQIHRRTDELRAVVAIDPLGQPRSKRNRSSTAATSSPRRCRPARISGHSRVNRSITVSARNRRPSVSSSDTKSMLQMSLRVAAGRRSSRCTAVACRHGRLRRNAKSSSQYTR